MPDVGAWCQDAHARFWNTQCPVGMPTTRMPGTQWGCPVVGVPSARMPGARWGLPVAGCPVLGGGSRCRDAWWGFPVAGCPVLSGGSRRRDARCPVGVADGGTPGGRRGARCRGARCAVLTAALEALPAAPPDEVPAEVAPGVEPAAPRLEAVPGARCRRQPRVGVRSGAGAGAGPAGRADAQRVGPLQAAPARPRLRLQLPQLDELHGGAGADTGDGAGAGTGRGRPVRAQRGKLRQERGGEGGTRAAPQGPGRLLRTRQARAGRAVGGDEAPGAAAGEGGALFQQPCSFRHLPGTTASIALCLSFPGEKQPKCPQRASTLGLATAPPKQLGLGLRSNSWAARPGLWLDRDVS